MTAFLRYGAFWWWFALLLLFAGNGVIDLSAAGPTVGVALLLWGVFPPSMWIGTFRLPKILFLIFLTLWVTFLLLGPGAAMGAGGLTRAAGMPGILRGGLARSGRFGTVTNATSRRTVLPPLATT